MKVLNNQNDSIRRKVGKKNHQNYLSSVVNGHEMRKSQVQKRGVL